MGVTLHTPDVLIKDLSSIMQEHMIVALCSDGVWDVFESDKVRRQCSMKVFKTDDINGANLAKFTKKLVGDSTRLWGNATAKSYIDDITALTFYLGRTNLHI